MKNVFHFLCLILLCCILTNAAFAYNLNQIAGKEKLSSRSIMTLCQDDKGLMWIGTNNGLNTYNGREFVSYIPKNIKGRLSGNFINSIVYTGNDFYWIQNAKGLNRYNSKTNNLLIYPEFNTAYFIDKDKHNNLFAIKENNCVYYFHQQSNSFKKIILKNIIFNDIIDFFIDKENTLWIVKKNSCFYRYAILGKNTNGELNLKPYPAPKNFQQQIILSSYDNNTVNWINKNNDLCSYDLPSGIEESIINLKEEVQSRGRILAILKYKGSFFVGFDMGGLIRLDKKKDTQGYAISELDIRCGINCIKKDRFQDFLWIGTGEGIYQYSESTYSIKSTVLSNDAYKMWRPVRALFIDNEKTFWVGNKGDGILKIYNYDVNKNIGYCKTEQINVSNSQLISNAVYCFRESQKNILWIGTEEGLNYFSYQERKIKRINLKVEGISVKYIHDIYEDKNLDLWLATVGMGILRIHVGGTNNTPVIESIKHFTIHDHSFIANNFFSIYPENDSVIWFSNKGYGPYKFNVKTDRLDSLAINYKNTNTTVNNVFSIIKDKSNNYLFGTGFGLVKYNLSGNYKIYNNDNLVVRTQLYGRNNDIWLGTSQGIIIFNAEKNLFRIFDNDFGTNVEDLNSGAAFKDKKTGTLYFGGYNGFISIFENDITEQKYMPAVNFSNLTLYGEKFNLFDFITKKGNIDILHLKYNQKFFSVAFTAIDYLNGHNYTYYYKLNGIGHQWINNEHSNIASFTNLSPGNYTLQVKYFNRGYGQESPVYSLNIHVDYPWYQSFVAYCLYAIITICFVYFVFRFLLLRIKHEEQKRLNALEIKHQKVVFESKLDFFTRITHEFSAPLTLISGPCERILSQKEINKTGLEYVKMIKINADRLHGLIQELIEFRKIETENVTLQIEPISISDTINHLIESYKVLAESKNINLESIINVPIQWNTDKGFFPTIVINLLSNAFKYTPNGKNIKFEISFVDRNLIIKISNDGRINEKDLIAIFDKYTILENFEKQENNQYFPRSGLGLAIISNMIKLLSGSIQVENLAENCVLFTIILPQIEITNNQFVNQNMQRYIPSVEIPITINHNELFDPLKSTLLIIDDDVQMLWFISDIFSGQYNTIWLQDSTKIDQKLLEFYPDLLISDVMMPGLDGIELIRKIKGSKETNHIPIILVSAKHEIEYQIEALAAGAEIYITKPFNTEYLRISVNQLFERKKELKNYLNSPISSFDLSGGKLTHKDHKKFLQSVMAIINDNLENTELSTEFIADKLGIGGRSFYRKLEEMGERNPSNLIRDSRLFVAANLLTQTTLTIDQIVYKTGYSKKETFYKSFIKKFECSPKEYRQRRMDELTK